MPEQAAGFWLSPQQKLAWTQQREGSSAALRAVCLVSIEGPLRPDALHQALRELVARHETLRTVFRRQVGMKVPFQVVLEASEPAWHVVSLRSFSAPERKQKQELLFRQEQARQIDFDKGPVFHASLLEAGDQPCALLLGLPAICADTLSWGILIRELGQLYSGQQVPIVGDLRYVQFAQWQNDLLVSKEDAAPEGRAFWQPGNPGDVPEPPLPFESKTDAPEFQPGGICFPITPSLGNALSAMAAKYKASGSDVLLAAWQCVLSRLSGQNGFATGVRLDDRGYEELEGSVGLLAKTVPVVARLEGDPSFREALEQSRESVQKAREWQEYFDPSSSETLLQYSYSELPAKQSYGDVTFEVMRQEVSAERFKLKLEVHKVGDSLNLRFHYDASRFSSDTIERWAAYFQTLLAAAVAAPETPVSRLPLLSPAERQQLLVDWNQTAADYPKLCLHQLFEAQAARTPDRPALRFADQQLTYRQLNQRANQFAHYLRTLGVGPDSLVDLALDRSADLMVAVLGILKAGGAYVPLNPDNPKPRLAQQLAGAVVLVTEQTLLPRMPDFAGPTLCLDRDQHLWAQQSIANPETNTTPENLAYIIYTSGSTGIPKGVAVRHRNLVNYSHFIAQRLELAKFPEGLHFATVSTIGADLGNTCIFPSLISGGCLHIIRYEDSTDSQRFARYTQRHPIDVLKIVPSHLQALLSASEGAEVLPRKFLITGGETLTPKLLEKVTALSPSCQVFNHYGPTETTIGSLTLKLRCSSDEDYNWKNSPAASIPIGRPLANTQLYLLDAHLEPVALGVIGELYIAGDGVTAGYLNQPDKTAERFLKNPFSQDHESKMYRTGDLARYWPDGNVEFLGRGDDQVKIRGFRIELGEIETALSQHPAVKQTVLLALEDEHGDKRLAAYVVAQSGQASSPDALRSYLKQHLPDYMVPSAFVLLPKIPLTPNGKIDRKALPAPEQAQAQTHTYVAPATPTEHAVAAIWADVLRRDQISTTDNFFDLGGHSLMATQVISRIREHFHIELAMRVLFEKPTIQAVSQAVDTAQPIEEDSAILPVSRDAYRASSK
jgi:amino acid adenylation domain-containing protein